MEEKAERARRDKEAELEEDKNTSNMLISDNWKPEQQKALQDYYKNNIRNQVIEKMREKMEKAKAEKEDDKEYMKNLMNAKNRVHDKKENLRARKRKIFLDDIMNQMKENDDMKNYKRDLDNFENEAMRNKLDHDNDKYRDNMFKKKKQIEQYINDLADQMQTKAD